MKALNRQTTIDMALQHCGTAEQALEFALRNGIAITDQLATSVNYVLPTAQKPEIARYYAVNNHIPARLEGESTLEGIEYWAIEIDFIVS